MTKQSPRLSVTVLSHNYGRYLAGCLDSILAQSFTDFEVIVIDDCSDDGTPRVLEPYRQDPRVRVVRHEQNRGFVGSLVEGTEELSRGELVTVVSADDAVIDRHAFARQIEVFDRTPDLSFCFSGFVRFERSPEHWTESVTPLADDRVLSERDAFATLLSGRHLHPLHSGTMIRAASYRRAGGYRRDLRMAIDCALWPLLALQGPVGYVATPLYGYRIHGGQMSQSLAVGRRCLEELMRGIDLGCAAAAARGWKVTALRDDARSFKIGAAAMEDAFAGRRRLALQRLLAAVSYRPVLALSSSVLRGVVVRLLLGESVTNRLRAALSRSPDTSLASPPSGSGLNRPGF